MHTAEYADPRSPGQRVAVPAMLATRPVCTSELFSLYRQTVAPAPGLLLMAIPKRVLGRAVDRNQVRRIARESWRAVRGPQCSQAILLRLKRRPQRFEGLPRGALKQLWRLEIDRLMQRWQQLADTHGPRR